MGPTLWLMSAQQKQSTPLLDRVHLPRRQDSPQIQVLRRIGFAVALVLFIALVVRFGRDGYIDVTEDPVSFLDALYYASVTVTTTGYGDITAVSDGARLATIVLITPARILFLILVVGTTVEVLTDQSRMNLLTRRWSKNVKDHYIICGFGATGSAVARDLRSRGVTAEQMVAIDIVPESIERATSLGMVGVLGDASQNSVLEQAGIDRAKAVIVVPNRDDTAVLVTLSARENNPNIHIVAGGRERENLHLLQQAGADEVVDATLMLGRMLGLGTFAPEAGRVLDDILDAGAGMELADVATGGVDDRVPAGATVVAVVRNGDRLRPDQVDLDGLRASDRLIVLREST